MDEQAARIKAKDKARILTFENAAKQKREQLENIEAKKMAGQVNKEARKHQKLDKITWKSTTMAQIQHFQAQQVDYTAGGE
jgi:hypothetical protein